jgi:hypothetical protein
MTVLRWKGHLLPRRPLHLPRRPTRGSAHLGHQGLTVIPTHSMSSNLNTTTCCDSFSLNVHCHHTWNINTVPLSVSTVTTHETSTQFLSQCPLSPHMKHQHSSSLNVHCHHTFSMSPVTTHETSTQFLSQCPLSPHMKHQHVSEYSSLRKESPCVFISNPITAKTLLNDHKWISVQSSILPGSTASNHGKRLTV